MRRRNLRDWRRGDPCSNPDWIRASARRSRTSHAGLHLCYLGSGCRHLLGALDPPSRLHRPGLGGRNCARHRWPARRIYRCSTPTAFARIGDSSPPRTVGSGDRHSLRLAGRWLNSGLMLRWVSHSCRTEQACPTAAGRTPAIPSGRPSGPDTPTPATSDRLRARTSARSATGSHGSGRLGLGGRESSASTAWALRRTRWHMDRLVEALRSRIQHPVSVANEGTHLNWTPRKVHPAQLRLEPANHVDSPLDCLVSCAAPDQLVQLRPREDFVSMLDQDRKDGGFRWEKLDLVSQAGRASIVDDPPFDEVDVQVAITGGGEGRRRDRRTLASS